jgi:hypothetical protein
MSLFVRNKYEHESRSLRRVTASTSRAFAAGHSERKKRNGEGKGGYRERDAHEKKEARRGQEAREKGRRRENDQAREGKKQSGVIE